MGKERQYTYTLEPIYIDPEEYWDDTLGDRILDFGYVVLAFVWNVLCKCCAWACLGLLILYLVVIWLPFDLLFAGLNKPWREYADY